MCVGVGLTDANCTCDALEERELRLALDAGSQEAAQALAARSWRRLGVRRGERTVRLQAAAAAAHDGAHPDERAPTPVRELPVTPVLAQDDGACRRQVADVLLPWAVRIDADVGARAAEVPTSLRRLEVRWGGQDPKDKERAEHAIAAEAGLAWAVRVRVRNRMRHQTARALGMRPSPPLPRVQVPRVLAVRMRAHAHMRATLRRARSRPVPSFCGRVCRRPGVAWRTGARLLRSYSGRRARAQRQRGTRRFRGERSGRRRARYLQSRLHAPHRKSAGTQRTLWPLECPAQMAPFSQTGALGPLLRRATGDGRHAKGFGEGRRSL